MNTRILTEPYSVCLRQLLVHRPDGDPVLVLVQSVQCLLLVSPQLDVTELTTTAQCVELSQYIEWS